MVSPAFGTVSSCDGSVSSEFSSLESSITASGASVGDIDPSNTVSPSLPESYEVMVDPDACIFETDFDDFAAETEYLDDLDEHPFPFVDSVVVCLALDLDDFDEDKYDLLDLEGYRGIFEDSLLCGIFDFSKSTSSVSSTTLDLLDFGETDLPDLEKCDDTIDDSAPYDMLKRSRSNVFPSSMLPVLLDFVERDSVDVAPMFVS
mmetsp:Transcript_21192/g.44486  ORF Transcript_21192/g.44486 Transcript_21192/m.44486 type:complete len:204 (-) Transcript_21192:630-1241(-)